MKKSMKELLYFSNLKLLTKVEYSKTTNSINYISHRKVTLDEKSSVEQYILTNFAPKTEYYLRSPSLLRYIGVNTELKKEMKLLRLKKILKIMAIREQDVKQKVDELISNSLSTYYFERIGDTILEVRKKMKDETVDNLTHLKQAKKNIEDLITAYNNYSDKKISLDKVLPKDLIGYFI